MSMRDFLCIIIWQINKNPYNGQYVLFVISLDETIVA